MSGNAVLPPEMPYNRLVDADDRLTITVTVSPSEVHCVAAGEIDPTTGPRLEGELRTALFGSSAPTCVLDLSEVTFIDSSGLRVLIDLHKAMRERDGLLLLRKPSPTVTRLLEITNLTSSLDIEA